jgi:1,4-dihydroxy-6-naphthoate synthase
MEKTLKKTVTVAHSPDADDIFMYYALKFGWIDTLRKTEESIIRYEFKNTAEDIETLNQKALKNVYDVSAISFGAYPFIKDEYPY